MTPDPDDARIARLRATRDRLEAQLADDRTPAYTVAPMSNQLRLVDKELDRIHRRVVADDDDAGLPTSPDKAGLAAFFRFGRRHRRVARGPVNEWFRRVAQIFDSWEAAGFVLPPATHRELDLSGEEHRAAVWAWLEECRLELARCLDNNRPTEKSTQP